MLIGLKKWKVRKELTPAEPLGDIHMPNGSFCHLLFH